MAESTTAPRFVVYTLCRPDGTPFYVGMGSRKRPFVHDNEARGGCTCPRCEVIRTVWRAGGEITRSIVFTTDDKHEAVLYEADTIARYDLTTLANKHCRGYVRDGRTAVPKVDSEGECVNRTDSAAVRRMLEERMP